MSLPRVAVVSNFAAPYRLATYAELARMVDLEVIYCANTGPGGCDWNLEGDWGFPQRVVGGITVHRTDRAYYASPRIAAALRGVRPDVVVANGYSIPTFYAAAYCAVAGARLVLFSEGTIASERALRPFQRAARRVLLPRAAAVVAPCRMAARRFVALGVAESRVFLAPYTTNVEPLWEVARSRPVDPGTGLRVLTVSRLVARKGLDRLLVALERAQRTVGDIELAIVGSGPEEVRLRRLANALGLRSVSFHGFVDQSRLPTHYAEADAFAFPTLDDPFGIVLFEAAASGLACISSPHAGATWDLVRHDSNGFVIDPRDVDALARGLVELAREPRRRMAMGRAAYEATLSRTPAAAAAAYASAIDSALACPGASKAAQ